MYPEPVKLLSWTRYPSVAWSVYTQPILRKKMETGLELWLLPWKFKFPLPWKRGGGGGEILCWEIWVRKNRLKQSNSGREKRQETPFTAFLLLTYEPNLGHGVQGVLHQHQRKERTFFPLMHNAAKLCLIGLGTKGDGSY